MKFLNYILYIRKTDNKKIIYDKENISNPIDFIDDDLVNKYKSTNLLAFFPIGKTIGIDLGKMDNYFNNTILLSKGEGEEDM
jgi:hypothetical protein